VLEAEVVDHEPDGVLGAEHEQLLGHVDVGAVDVHVLHIGVDLLQRVVLERLRHL
jgi:hypothetical protein